MPGSPFTGPERIATFPPLARPMRVGRTVAEGRTYSRALRDALDSQGFTRASSLLELMYREHSELIAILGEWALQLVTTLAQLADPAAARETSASALARHLDLAGSMKTSPHATAAVNFVSAAMRTRIDTPESWTRETGRPAPFEALCTDATQRFQTARAAIAANDADEAGQDIAACLDFSRAAHDALVEFINTFALETAVSHGEVVAEELLKTSFSACSFFEPLWSMGLLPPVDLAAFLATHLRAHFSGHNRGGGVEVVEDEDKYRLIFDACGSGGAMRRRHQANAVTEFKLRSARPATWMRAGEVPPYCSHCAFNELESIRRFGYPILVTEFDPDPARPCGWTVYKRAAAVPSRYYERLGLSPPRDDDH